MLSRWLTRTELVQAWDAGNFVLALDRLDLAAQQPHLPGCFWNLIVLGRALRPLTGGNGVAALELLNALAAGVAVPCAWLLGRQMATPRTGWWAAVLVLTAPLLWFYGSQPLSYGVELGWVLAIALCGWLVAAGRASALVPLALLMAIAGGIRPQHPCFYCPWPWPAAGGAVGWASPHGASAWRCCWGPACWWPGSMPFWSRPAGCRWCCGCCSNGRAAMRARALRAAC